MRQNGMSMAKRAIARSAGGEGAARGQVAIAIGNEGGSRTEGAEPRKEAE